MPASTLLVLLVILAAPALCHIGAEGTTSRSCPRELNASLHYNTFKAEDTGYCFCFYVALKPAALFQDEEAYQTVANDVLSIVREPCSNEYLSAKADCSRPIPPRVDDERKPDVLYRNGSWALVTVSSYYSNGDYYRYEWRGVSDCHGLGPQSYNAAVHLVNGISSIIDFGTPL